MLAKPVALAGLLAALSGALTAGSDAEPASEEGTLSTASQGPGRRVLVVDDAPELRSVLEEFLAVRGYVVRSVANAAEALRASADESPDTRGTSLTR